MNKKTPALLILIFILSACEAATANNPVVAHDTLTPTVPLSSTSSPTAAPTAEAKPTVDPNMPEGATGKDAQGNYIRPLLDANVKPVIAENGKRVNETWLTFPSGPNGETMSGWFVNHIKDGTLNGGIPALDKTAVGGPGLPIYFMVKDGINAKYMKHQPMTGINPGGYMGAVEYLLMSRYYQKPVSQVSS